MVHERHDHHAAVDLGRVQLVGHRLQHDRAFVLVAPWFPSVRSAVGPVPFFTTVMGIMTEPQAARL